MIDVVGVPAAGVAALPPDLRHIVDRAAVVVSSPRLLASVPEGFPARRIEWPRPLLAGLESLLDSLRGGPQPVVVLATGDPLDHGIGTTLVRLLGADAVRVHPVAGAVALARARMGWSAQETDVVSLVNSPVSCLRPLLSARRRVLALSADDTTPGAVSQELVETGWPDARLTVLGNLGELTESRHDLIAHALAASQAAPGVPLPRLNVVAIELGDGPTVGTSPGRPDAQYEHDGQLSKQEIRALALAALRPAPGQLLWDLGAGAGSVAIEWLLHDVRCRAIAVERHPQRAARIARNATQAGVTGVRVIESSVLDAIPELPTPDAIFLGGGISTEIIDHAWAALRPGGRLVAHTVTLDTEALIIAAYRRYGGSLRRLSIERVEPLGRYVAWQPARPVVEWAVVRPHEGAAQ